MTCAEKHHASDLEVDPTACAEIHRAPDWDLGQETSVEVHRRSEASRRRGSEVAGKGLMHHLKVQTASKEDERRVHPPNPGLGLPIPLPLIPPSFPDTLPTWLPLPSPTSTDPFEVRLSLP